MSDKWKKQQSRNNAGYYQAGFIRTERNKRRRAEARKRKANSPGAKRRAQMRADRKVQKRAAKVARQLAAKRKESEVLDTLDTALNAPADHGTTLMAAANA